MKLYRAAQLGSVFVEFVLLAAFLAIGLSYATRLLSLSIKASIASATEVLAYDGGGSQSSGGPNSVGPGPKD